MRGLTVWVGLDVSLYVKAVGRRGYVGTWVGVSVSNSLSGTVGTDLLAAFWQGRPIEYQNSE